LWLLFSLHSDVGYFAEPMVYYRRHDLTMTNVLHEKDPAIWGRDELAVLWRIRRAADEAGGKGLARCADVWIARKAISLLLPPADGRCGSSLTVEEFEASLETEAATTAQRRLILSDVRAGLGDAVFWAGNYTAAAREYERSLEERWFQPVVLAKRLLLRMGPFGNWGRHAIRALREGRVLRSSRAS
jgi:hypothetical protein